MTLIYAGIFKASQKCLISLGTFENPSLSSFLSSQSHSQSVKSSLHRTQREFCPSVSSKARIQTTQANFYFVHFFSFFFFLFGGREVSVRWLTVFDSGIVFCFYCFVLFVFICLFYLIPSYAVLLALWVWKLWEATSARKGWKKKKLIGVWILLFGYTCWRTFSRPLVMLWQILEIPVLFKVLNLGNACKEGHSPIGFLNKLVRKDRWKLNIITSFYRWRNEAKKSEMTFQTSY